MLWLLVSPTCQYVEPLHVKVLVSLLPEVVMYEIVSWSITGAALPVQAFIPRWAATSSIRQAYPIEEAT